MTRTILLSMAMALLIASASYPQPPDGTYEGTTAQQLPIEITVSGGAVTRFRGDLSCGSSGSYDTSTTCSIGAGGGFSCGSLSCPAAPFGIAVRISGTFSGTSVSGDVDFMRNPCFTPCSCTACLDVSFSAELGAPAISIDDIVIVEGDSGTTAAQFAITRSFDPGDVATVDWITADGSADSTDYASASGTVTFNPGETSATISVSVFGDTDPEPDEFFNVDLSNPVNATIADSQGVCTIDDDDRPGSISRTVDIAGIESIDGFGDPDNTVVSEVLGPDAVLTGASWDVHLTTFGASFLSEVRLYFDGSDQDGSGLVLSPGAGDDFPGSASYSGSVVLTDVGIPEIPILSDGRLFIQFFESFDDDADSADAVFDPSPPSTITLEYIPSPSLIFFDGFESGDSSAWN